MIETEPFFGWKIRKPLGKGAYSNVFLAEKDGAFSAIKQIIVPNTAKYNLDYSRFRGNTNEIKKFYKPEIDRIMKEVKMLTTLNGTHGIVIYQDHLIREYYMRPGWELLIRMEYLTPLNKYINKNGLRLFEVIKMGIDLCYALEVCNKKGILHRDIKESNILVNSSNEFKLCDFGVAKYLEGTYQAHTVTGTQGYMAPEVTRGEKYDHRADIYSLGIVMYTLLNDLLLPFMTKCGSSSDEQKCRILLLNGNKLSKPKYANMQITNVILKACMFKKEDRYSSFFEFGLALKQLIQSTPKNLLYSIVVNKLAANLNLNNTHFSFYHTLLKDSFNEGKPIKQSNNLKESLSPSKQPIQKNQNSIIAKPKSYSKFNKTNFKKLLFLGLIVVFISFIILPKLINIHYQNSDFFKISQPPSPFNISNSNKDIPNKSKIGINSYIKFGRYLNNPIVWKCRSVNDDGFMFVSEYLLCLKAFDSAESGTEGSGDTDIEMYGNNNWEKSTLRDWLNSENQKVFFSSKPPNASSVWKGYNPYENEAGFLSSFTPNEFSKLNPIVHGKVTDYIFLLSKQELLNLFKDKTARCRIPTKAAISHSSYKSDNLKQDYTWWYWTRDFEVGSDSNVNYIDGDGSYDNYLNATNGLLGILPALSLKNNIAIYTGKGTIESPFILR